MALSASDIQLTSSDDGLGVVITIFNSSSTLVTVYEPHPHTSVRLLDDTGELWPAHYGPFLARPHWRVIVEPNETSRRIVLLPPFFVSANGRFDVVCDIGYLFGDREIPDFIGPEINTISIRGSVHLALPGPEDCKFLEEYPVGSLMYRYKQSGYVYPLTGK